MSDEPILDIVEVIKRYGDIPVVDRASLSISRGSITALIGPNGAGKTSLFNVVSGFARLDGGKVRLAGKRIERLAPHRIARAGMVRTFQNPKILRRMTVLENMLLGATHQPGESLWRVFTPHTVRERECNIEKRARDLLDAVHLTSHVDAYAGTLSGGQRKLLEFARALMTEPQIILLDEPLAGVNPVLRAQLLEQIQATRERDGVTIVVIEHDLETVMAISDRVVVMNEGRVIFAGPPDDVQVNEDVISAYLGAHHTRSALESPA